MCLRAFAPVQSLLLDAAKLRTISFPTKSVAAFFLYHSVNAMSYSSFFK